MPLSGMLAEVTQTKVAGLLHERRTDILDASIPEQAELFDGRVMGAAAEVRPLVGEDPPHGRIRDLAVEAIVYQTASEIEEASYPEQMAPGDQMRAQQLHRRYLELLKLLREILAANGGRVPADGHGVLPGTPSPRGSFPAGAPYPDPAVTPPSRQDW